MSPSDPVVVVATIEFAPGSEDAGLRAFEEAIPLVHEEDGCLAYALHRDRSAPNRFVFVERWASKDALDAHGKTAHMGKVVEAIGGLVAAPPTVVELTALPRGDSAKGVL